MLYFINTHNICLFIKEKNAQSYFESDLICKVQWLCYLKLKDLQKNDFPDNLFSFRPNHLKTILKLMYKFKNKIHKCSCIKENMYLKLNLIIYRKQWGTARSRVVELWNQAYLKFICSIELASWVSSFFSSKMRIN
jgi:hypothetical protein